MRTAPTAALITHVKRLCHFLVLWRQRLAVPTPDSEKQSILKLKQSDNHTYIVTHVHTSIYSIQREVVQETLTCSPET